VAPHELQVTASGPATGAEHHGHRAPGSAGGGSGILGGSALGGSAWGGSWSVMLPRCYRTRFPRERPASPDPARPCTVAGLTHIALENARGRSAAGGRSAYSHSMVAGGLELMS